MGNFSVDALSWAPAPYEKHFTEIKGIIAFLFATFIISVAIIYKLYSLHKKTAISEGDFDDLLSKIDKLELQALLPSHTTDSLDGAASNVRSHVGATSNSGNIDND